MPVEVNRHAENISKTKLSHFNTHKFIDFIKMYFIKHRMR